MVGVVAHQTEEAEVRVNRSYRFSSLSCTAGLLVLLGWVFSLAGSAQAADCTQLLQAQDKEAVAACKAQLDEAEKGPATERMARIVAADEYGVALLGVGKQPRLALAAFDRAVGLLPASTVKPDSLQWAVTFWHRATAYQQLSEWNQAVADLNTAENALNEAIAATAGNSNQTQHFAELRQRVRAQHAAVLKHQGSH